MLVINVENSVNLQEAQNKIHCCFLVSWWNWWPWKKQENMKQKLAPCNGTTSTATSNDTTSTPSKLVVTRLAHYNDTLQRHHPSPHHNTMVACNGTQQWHHVHCTLQWHRATSNPPKWFVALPPIGSKNPYSYWYLGKKNSKKRSQGKKHMGPSENFQWGTPPDLTLGRMGGFPMGFSIQVWVF